MNARVDLDTVRRGRIEDLGVPREAVRVLAACAASRALTPDLPLEDPLAAAVHESLGGCAQQFTCSELRHSALRTLVIDQLAGWFFQRQPRGLGVGAWSVLGTRAHRLPSARWVDLDVPEVARLRRRLLPERPGWTQASACLCCSPWADSLCGAGERVLLFVLDESALGMPGSALVHFLDEVSRVANSGSEVVLAFDRRTPVRPILPLTRSSAAELVLRDASGSAELIRYPRLRFVDEETYPGEVGYPLAGVNALARIHRGIAHPAIAHLVLV